MANVNRPAGLVPLEYLDGNPWNGKCRMYYIASTDANAYSIGDPVTRTAGGDAAGVPGITLATAGDGNVILGAIVGYGGSKYGGPGAVPGAIDTTIIPATKTAAFYVLVADDPNIIFQIQEGGVGSALTSATVSKNVNLLSGTNNGYTSGWLMDNNSTGTGSTKQLQMMGLVQTIDNAFGTYAKWRVRINNHQFAAGTAGV